MALSSTSLRCPLEIISDNFTSAFFDDLEVKLNTSFDSAEKESIYQIVEAISSDIFIYLNSINPSLDPIGEKEKQFDFKAAYRQVLLLHPDYSDLNLGKIEAILSRIKKLPPRPKGLDETRVFFIQGTAKARDIPKKTGSLSLKPYLLTEYFAKKAGWQQCHVRTVPLETDSKGQINEGSVPRCSMCLEDKHPSPSLSFPMSYFKQLAQKSSPPSSESFEIKSPIRSFNHVHDFIIHEGIIWFRFKDLKKREWLPIFFDGFANGKVPQSLHVDGANLVVLDEEGVVHYKKVLREHRRAELITSKLVDPNWQVSYPYIAVDKAAKSNWKEAWFTLPVLGPIINLFNGKQISIPKSSLAWGISHRGTYNDHYEDDAGASHPVNTGVTTLYALLSSGKDIKKFDPWSPPKADMNIIISDQVNSTFKAFNMSPSASTLMIMGYESKASPSGGTTKTLKVKTRLADIDTEGFNPGLKYTYFEEEAQDDAVRMISKGRWVDHPLPDDILPTGEISIVQIGEGNEARELRVEAYKEKDKNHSLGCYYKTLAPDSYWQFRFYQEQTDEVKDIKPTVLEDDEPLQSTVFNWVGVHCTTTLGVTKPDRIELLNFGKYSETADLVLHYPQGKETLNLRKRKTICHFFGPASPAYDLINYSGQIAKSLFSIFNKKVERVSVSESSSQVIIKGLRFGFVFEKILDGQNIGTDSGIFLLSKCQNVACRQFDTFQWVLSESAGPVAKEIDAAQLIDQLKCPFCNESLSKKVEKVAFSKSTASMVYGDAKGNHEKIIDARDQAQFAQWPKAVRYVIFKNFQLSSV